MRYNCFFIRTGFLTFLFLLVFLSLSAQEINTSYFDFWKYYKDGPDALYKELVGVGLDQLAERKDKVAQLKTKEDWQNRQKEVRSTLLKIIGEFPAKSPLNAQVTGKIDRPEFSVEKIVFESVPGYFVTSALFIPKNLKRKAPVVIYCSGHTADGFRSATYQHIIINLVKKGFIVYAFDPIGQGERYQYLDEAGKPKFGSTHEHSYAGTQCMISGYSPAKYFIWDGIRAIDYLLTRPEVDGQRIGITGRSGGGTQSAYIAAIDDRVTAAAPECYITSYDFIMKSIGPQDGEQNLFRGLAEGIDHPDFLLARAPKPTMIISTTRDFFAIQGARNTFEEAKLAFDALGEPAHLYMVEDDSVHASTRKNREAMYAFFQKHLNNPGDNLDREVEVFEASELKVSPTGQVLSSYQGETLFSLNRSYTNRLIEATQKTRMDGQTDQKEVKETVLHASGYQEPADEPELIFSGRIKESSYTYEYYLMQGQGDYMVPLLYAGPTRTDKKEVIILFSESGKEMIKDPESTARKLLKEGYKLIIPDLPGFGELGPGYLKGDAYIHGVSHNQWYTGMLTGKSLLSLRTEEIVKIVHITKSQFMTDHKTPVVLGEGPLNSEVIHAALFESDMNKIILIDPLISYYNLTTTENYESKWVHSAVPGMLQSYDLPDILACFNDRELLIISPKNAASKPIDGQSEENELTFLNDVMTKGSLELNFSMEEAEKSETVIQWMKADR